MKVYVLDQENKPLMPTKPAIARLMIKQNKAKVVKRIPFTIQLIQETTKFIQPIKLGIDSGYSNMGFSCITEKEELISGEVKLDSNMSKRILDKSMYRKTRRSRLRYRKPRFLNRISTKKKGWLPPSIKRRYETHLNLVKQLKQILPISNIIVEVGSFDIQKIINPNIRREEYQHGDPYQYKNRINYLIVREKGRCQLCRKQYKKGDGWQLHHIYGKTHDRPKDWALLHKSCHKKLHKEELENKLKLEPAINFKGATFMNIVRWKYKEDLNCDITFGNITFINRNILNIEKSHVNDAFVIAGGKDHHIRFIPYNIIQKRKNNRKLQLNRKGFKPSIRKQRYSLQPHDLVKINNQIFKVVGVQNYGAYIGVRNSNKLRVISIKKLDNWKYHSKTLVW